MGLARSRWAAATNLSPGPSPRFCTCSRGQACCCTGGHKTKTCPFFFLRGEDMSIWPCVHPENLENQTAYVAI